VLLAGLPGDIGGYVEPYLDSGVFALTVVQRHPDARVSLASTEADLVRSWEVARKEPEALLDALEFHAERHRAPYFAGVLREGDEVDEVARAARYIYLRGTAAPDARGESPVRVEAAQFGREGFPVDAAGIRALSRFLREHDVSVDVRSPFELLPAVREDDLVLLDPPFAEGGAVGREAKSFRGCRDRPGSAGAGPGPEGFRCDGVCRVGRHGCGERRGR
jgi:site-specific DNA-adenine methylase